MYSSHLQPPTFKQELHESINFCLTYGRAIFIIIIATTLMVIVKSPSMQLLSGFWGQAHYESALIYGVIPCLLLVALGHTTFDSLALRLGNWRFWVPASGLYLCIAIPILILGSKGQSLSQYYQAPSVNWPSHIGTTLIYLLGWEYFFRGFLLTGLRHTFKEGAILLQMIPFTLLHLGKPDAETLSCILSGLVWGYICYRARSFWPAFFMHAIVNFSMLAVANI